MLAEEWRDSQKDEKAKTKSGKKENSAVEVAGEEHGMEYGEVPAVGPWGR